MQISLSHISSSEMWRNYLRQYIADILSQIAKITQSDVVLFGASDKP